MVIINWIVQIFILIIFSHHSLSKVIKGELVTNENWAFLSRFCFYSNSGKFIYHIIYPVEYRVQNLLMYYDSKQQWPSAYKSNKTCEEKEALLSFDNGQVIYLIPEFQYSGCELTQVETEASDNTTQVSEYINCTHYRMFRSIRERWWFIAVSNCKSTKGLRLKYHVTMINDDDDGWLRHFSADQFYILHTDVIFTILYYVLLLASFFEANALNSRHLLHITYKMYLSSLIMECLSLTFLVCYYGMYAADGVEKHWIKLIGKTLEAISTLIFLMLLILLAKGYTVTRGRIKPVTATKMGIFMCIYTIIYGAIFFYEQMCFDPGEVLYLYESWPGYGLIFLRILGWTWFMYAIVFTLIHYPTKSAFFTNLFLLYSIWFISAPVVILISTFVVPKWMREKIINSVELFIAFYAHTVFFILTRPSKANKNFPFHVRTTQIDVMSKVGESAGETLDHFTHYGYAPSKPLNSKQPVYSSSQSSSSETKTESSRLDNGSKNSKPTSNTSINHFINGYSNNPFPTLPAIDSGMLM